MKYCPVCKIEYSDKAQFCAKCEAALLEKEESEPKVKADYKRLIKALALTGAFIVFIVAIYYVFYFLTK